MNRELLQIAAEVLEKAAAYMDAVELEKTSAVLAERTKIAEALRTRFTELTGESVDDGIVQKLASSDADVVSLFTKLAGSTQAPDPMGGPSETADYNAAPRSTKEAALAADDQFAAWLMS